MFKSGPISVSSGCPVGCTGASIYVGKSIGVTGKSFSYSPPSPVKLEIGKIYTLKAYACGAAPGSYIRVFGPISVVAGEEYVRVKYWDPDYYEWDKNTLLPRVTKMDIEEVSKLTALVLFGNQR